MMASARLNRLLLLAFLWWSPIAYAADGLVVDEPESQLQSEKYSLQVLGDGFARLRVKWSGTEEHSVNLSLSAFQPKADSEKVTVGLARDEKQDVGSMLPNLQGVKVSAKETTTVLLVASGLSFDKDYTGELFAEFRAGDKLEKRSWKITLSRPGPVEPFRCPPAHQLINADGTTSIEFQRTSPLKTVGLRLSSFVSKDQREPGVVGFAGDSPSQGLQTELSNYAVADRLVPPIRTVNLTEGATYAGKITFVVAGREVKDCPLDLEMPKLLKGEVLTDSPSPLIRAVTLTFFGCCGTNEPLWARLRDKSGLRRIDGLTATLDGATESPDGSLDIERHVTFFLNGNEVKKFMEWPDPGSQAIRTLQPGGQLELKMAFHNLQAGKYQLPLKFTATNATASPKLDITVNVRHHWLWAVLAVVLAMVVSWLITSGIVNWRERNRVRARVVQLQAENFDAHGDFPSVVFLHAVLAQAKSAAARGVLPVPSSVNDYLQRAERVASIMRRYRDVYDKLEKALCTETVKLHYRESISDAMGRLGPYPLDDKTRDAILAELDVISARLDSPLVWYWSHVTSEAALLFRQVQGVKKKLGDPGNQAQKQKVEQLLTTLEKAPVDPNSKEAEAFDRAYWFVKLLYSRRNFGDENKTLIEKFNASGDNVEEAFRAGDEFAWERLKKASIEIEVAGGTQVEGDGKAKCETLERLRPTTFMLNFRDSTLAESYLVTKVLRYEWKFAFTREEAKGLRGKFLKRTSGEGAAENPPKFLKGTRAAFYAPAEGSLTVEATIHRLADDGVKAEVIALGSKTFRIGENPEVRLGRRLNRPDLWATAGAGAVALATSLPIYYFNKATFGSVADYVAILTWAIGIDQGKNLIQVLKATQPAGSSP